MTTEREPISFLGKRIDPAFEKRVVAIAPDDSRACDESEWRDALILVERGEIEVEGVAGNRRTFGVGDVLCLAELPLRVLRNRGGETAVLVAVSRRHPSTD